jgi:PKD repeat protein
MRIPVTYARALISLMVVSLLVSYCEREPAVDHDGDTGKSVTAYQSNVVKLDSMIFVNPVRINGSVRFDLIGTPPTINPGDIVYYPGGEGVFGKVVTVSLSGSRMVFQLIKSGLEQVFKSISMQDNVSQGVVKSKIRTDKGIWYSDSLRLDGFRLYNDLWQSKSLEVSLNNGRLYSNSSVGQFMLSGQGKDPWFDRCQLKFDYSIDLTSEIEIRAGGAMDATDSLLVEKDIYGPYIINGFPVTYQIDTWLGFHIVTLGDTVLTLSLSGLSKGNLSLSYNYWENWKFSQNFQQQSAAIQLYNGPRFSSYHNEIFVCQIITPIFCGEPSFAVTNRFTALADKDVTIPNWQSTQRVTTQGLMLRLGQTFGTDVPSQLTTDETLVYSESQSGVLENQAPKAAFTIDPPVGFTDTNFKFDASVSTDLESASELLMVRWDFNGDNHFDTEFSTTKVAYYRYTRPGPYVPVLEVKDEGGLLARKTSSIDVSTTASAPIAYFTVTPESGRISANFVFDAQFSYDAVDPIDSLKFRWDFEGDDTWDTGWSDTLVKYHFFSNEGKYVPKLEVMNTQGLTGSTTRIVNVAPANIKPTAFFTVDPEFGTTETRFYFDASGSTDPEDPTVDLEVRWDWDNDGTYDTSYRTMKSIQHTFPVAGTYTVVMEVIDTELYGATYAREIKVTNPNTPPIADFSTIPADSAFVGQEVTFDAGLSSDAEDNPDQLETRWDWNNDNIYDTPFSLNKIIRRTFNEPGTYIIKLQVRDSGGLLDFRVRLMKIK